MTVTDRVEIIVNILEIYKKVQIAGGTPAVKSEILSIFKDIITSKDEKDLQEIMINYIDKGVIR